MFLQDKSVYPMFMSCMMMMLLQTLDEGNWSATVELMINSQCQHRSDIWEVVFTRPTCISKECQPLINSDISWCNQLDARASLTSLVPHLIVCLPISLTCTSMSSCRIPSHPLWISSYKQCKKYLSEFRRHQPCHFVIKMLSKLLFGCNFDSTLLAGLRRT